MADKRLQARHEFAEVGRAMRAAIERANAAGLTANEHRVFLAVIAEVATYSRLEDFAYAEQIAARAGLSERRTRDILRRLAERELIVWRPKRGRSDKPESVVGLLPADHSNRTPMNVLFLDEANRTLLERPVCQDEVKADVFEVQSGRSWTSGTREVPEKKNQPRFKDNHGAHATAAVAAEIKAWVRSNGPGGANEQPDHIIARKSNELWRKLVQAEREDRAEQQAAVAA